jgi:hypothetical protein
MHGRPGGAGHRARGGGRGAVGLVGEGAPVRAHVLGEATAHGETDRHPREGRKGRRSPGGDGEEGGRKVAARAAGDVAKEGVTRAMERPGGAHHEEGETHPSWELGGVIACEAVLYCTPALRERASADFTDAATR